MIQHRKPSYTLHDNFRMPMGFPVNGFVSGLTYNAQPGDTFIATYPKCGTTWTQYIVWLIQNDGEPLSADGSLSVDIPHLEEVGKEIVEALPPPRFIKTHLPYSMTPYHSEAKYIYVARNPFDCVVSFYHHTRGFVKHYDFAEGTFDDFFECFMTGEVDFGDYFDNLLPWFERRDDRNVLFLTYEAMKADPQKAVIQIANFLGEEYSKKVEDREILTKILKASSFEKMSQNQERWSSTRPKTMPPFVRKGEVGDWKNYFSPEQTRRLTKKFIDRTKETGLEGLWGDFILDLDLYMNS